VTAAATAADVDEFADAFFAAIERGDLDAVAARYAGDATIWHNTDEVDQTREDNLRTLRRLARLTAGRAYVDVVRHAIPGGFVQQHVLELTFADGRCARLPACLFARLERRDGRLLITRIEEYLDGVGVAAAFAPAP